MSQFEFEKGTPIPAVVMTLGRGYEVTGEDVAQYEPTAETRNRAVEAATYYISPRYQTNPYEDSLFLFSGRYGRIASRGAMPEPPEGVSEAVMQEKIFVKLLGGPEAQILTYQAKSPDGKRQQYERYLRDHEWGGWYSKPVRRAVETNSVDTFTNFTESIDAGLLPIGGFSPKRPLAVSTCGPHAWRTSVIAEQSLALEAGSFYKMPARCAEGPKMAAQERVLLAVTRLALADIGETGGAEPGNLAHTKAAAEAFEAMSQQPLLALGKALMHPDLWRAPEVALLPY